MKKINRKTLIFVCITFVLFIIPFFWLKQGELSLGGDSNRLYFYDPISNLKSFAIYSVVPWGTGIISYNQYFIPYLLLLAILKFFFQSPTILINIFNGLKLSLSFFFIFLIIKELLKKERLKDLTIAEWCGAIIGGIFYSFSSAVLDNLKYALITHDLVFLSPAIFYLILLSLKKVSLKYVWIALAISFVFSSSFSLYGPPIFAFFPLSFSFLLLYNFYILQKKFPLKGIIFTAFFYLGLHAFHIFPVLTNVLDKGSQFNMRVFESTSKVNAGLDYFSVLLQFSKLSHGILLPLENQKSIFTLIVIPFLMILGFIFSKKNKTIFLLCVFFFITLFLTSGNITSIGNYLYKSLFVIPGFGMFENFFGQWQFVYTFFYSLLSGVLISTFFSKLRKKYTYLIFVLVIGCILSRSPGIFNGSFVKAMQRGSKGMSAVIKIDPHYEAMLKFIKNIPNDGKVLHVPFTDFAYNLVGGVNNGVYVGQSFVSLLDGKNDFAGYQHIDPFSESFRTMVINKDYQSIKEMLSLLQVRYILYNADQKISNKYFTEFPYSYTEVPASAPESLDFVEKISSQKIFQTGNYSLFEVGKDQYLPHFYIPLKISLYENNPRYNKQFYSALSFFPPKETIKTQDPRMVFMDSESCKKLFSKQTCLQQSIVTNQEKTQIIFQRLNPTKYRVEIRNANKPFLLVFQNAYSPHWKLFSINSSINIYNISDTYFNGSIVELNSINEFIDANPFQTNSLKQVFDNYHVEANGYANAWYIYPNNSAGTIDLIVEETSQKMFYYSFLISLTALVAFIAYGVKLFLKREHE